MAKRMYADVVMNGHTVNLSLRASSEQEARAKLKTKKWKGVTEVFDVSPNPPRREEAEKENKNVRRRGRNQFVTLYTGGILHV